MELQNHKNLIHKFHGNPDNTQIYMKNRKCSNIKKENKY